MTDEMKIDERQALVTINNSLIDKRTSLWMTGKFDAALAVDDARNKIASAMHDLRRAETNV